MAPLIALTPDQMAWIEGWCRWGQPVPAELVRLLLKELARQRARGDR